MQAIWDHEPPDQRFFRLYQVQVPDITYTPSLQVTLYPIYMAGTNPPADATTSVGVVTIPDQVQVTDKSLVEVADLDNLLGYKGNYMIFPLKKNNGITLYMMQDYIEIDEVAHLHDPDEFGQYTTEELVQIMKCYHKETPGGLSEDDQQKFKDVLIKRLTNPRREKDEIVVPTDSLYIEALPGKHPILEDFKLIHRAVDVKNVQAEVRHSELENIRLAARVLKGEYEDPDIDKKIVVQGDPNVDIQTD
ncbi:MAG: hypothetical protein L0154_30415 [Chloroflexi bacterium]|nr:hypothetical protein [Chloroflexota bacterium]